MKQTSLIRLILVLPSILFSLYHFFPNLNGQASGATIESLWASSPVPILAIDSQNRVWTKGKTLSVGYLGQESSELIDINSGSVTFELTGKQPITELDLPGKDGKPRELLKAFPKLLGSPRSIAFAPSGLPWVAFSSQLVARYNGSHWIPVAAKADQIYFGGDDSLWATLGPRNNRSNQYPYKVLKWENSTWKDMGKQAIRFAVDGDGNAWALTRLPNRKVVLEMYKSGAWQAFPLPQEGSPSDLLTIDPFGKLCIHARVNPYRANTAGVYGVFRLENRKWNLIAENTEKSTGTVDYNEFFVMEKDRLYLGGYYKPENAVRATEDGSQFANFGFHFFDVGTDGTLWAAKTSVGGRGLLQAFKWLGENSWEVYPLDDRVLDLDVDDKGSAWICGFYSIYRLHNGKTEKMTGVGQQIAIGENGDIAGMQMKNGKLHVAKRDQQQFHTVSKEPLQFIKNKMPGIAIDGTGTIWSIQPAKNPIDPRNHYEPVKLVDGRWVTIDPPEGKFASPQPGAPTSGKDGSVHYAFGNTTYASAASMYKRDGDQWVEDSSLPAYGIRTVDSDGNYWHGPAMITTNRKDLKGWTAPEIEETTQVSSTHSGAVAEASAPKSTLQSQVDSTPPGAPKAKPAEETGTPDQQEPTVPSPTTAPPSIAGCWYWSNGSYVTITDDGKAKIGDIVGLWEKNSDSESTYTISWPGIIDTIAINRENTEFQGKGLFNTPVSAIRIGPAGKELAGTWKRIDGAILEIAENHKVTTGDFFANWEKTGERRYKITWPLDDQITLSQDGTSLKIKNQFASITANRDPTCDE